VELRTFNGQGDAPQSTVELHPRQERTIRGKLKIADAQKPWLVVAILAGDVGNRKELFGTAVRRNRRRHYFSLGLEVDFTCNTCYTYYT
jgi:hypothetical protein